MNTVHPELVEGLKQRWIDCKQSTKPILSILALFLLATTSAMANDCGQAYINPNDSDGYINHARCTNDPLSVGAGEITLETNGYLELTSAEPGNAPPSRVRCENKGKQTLRLKLSLESEWTKKISASTCSWNSTQFNCGKVPEMVCLIETQLPVKQTLAIYAMVHVKEAVFDTKQDETSQLREWLNNQHALADFCRQSANLDWPLQASLAISKEGKITVKQASAVEDQAHQQFNACLSEHLSRHTVETPLNTNYSIDWQIDAP